MESLGNSLTGLIEYLKNIAPEVWKILLKQQMVEGWSRIVWAIFLLLLCIILIPIIKKLKKGFDDADYSNEDGYAIGIFFGWAAFFLSLIFTPVLLVEGIKHLINPEYYAIMQILNGLK